MTKYYEQNQGVDVRYYEQVKNATERPPDTLFVWKTMESSPCSKACAGGKKNATIIDKKSWNDTDCSVVFNSYIAGRS